VQEQITPEEFARQVCEVSRMLTSLCATVGLPGTCPPPCPPVNRWRTGPCPDDDRYFWDPCFEDSNEP